MNGNFGETLFNTLYPLILPLHQSSRGGESICTSLFTTLLVGMSQGQGDQQINQDLTPSPQLLVIPSQASSTVAKQKLLNLIPILGRDVLSSSEREADAQDGPLENKLLTGLLLVS